jgi:hypothetical protein
MMLFRYFINIGISIVLEILLSVIEIIGEKFEADSLGPGTIVGSAAFNFFIIIGICMYAIPGKLF